ncbi:hypothetical protein [Homoserinimonas sp. OAct 916]|uniref:hypothetical protein n=1 Tax=Homoserinimonas sp. OAct 916 TaxID=2211450 RepID=UPI000DBE85AC|nr:hypothetical protein [Homoserinimonas sp. OAct 916]
MGKKIDFDALAGRISEYGFAYLITVGDDDRIHTSPVNPTVTAPHLAVNTPSARVRANTSSRPQVSLVWPPTTSDGYSLIVDGEARVVADSLTVTPTRAILHRPAPRPDPGADDTCGSDCIEL